MSGRRDYGQLVLQGSKKSTRKHLKDLEARKLKLSRMIMFTDDWLKDTTQGRVYEQEVHWIQEVFQGRKLIEYNLSESEQVKKTMDCAANGIAKMDKFRDKTQGWVIEQEVHGFKNLFKDEK